MQGDVATHDILVGAAVLAVALPAMVGAGLLLARFKNARFRRAWAPLAPLLDGATVTSDGGGAATSWLTGRYRGAPVGASMTPDVRAGMNSSHNGNRFTAVAREVRGAQDWSVVWTDQILGLGTSGCQLRADDSALVRRLEAAGVLDLATRLGRVDRVDYSARERTLTLREQVEPLWTPPPARVRLELDVLLELAAANAAANPA